MSRCGLVLKRSNEICSWFGGLKITFPFQFELVAGEMGQCVYSLEGVESMPEIVSMAQTGTGCF